MATKNLDLYKLGVVLDAAGTAKGIAALKEADKSATKVNTSLTQLAKPVKLGIADKFKAEMRQVEREADSAGRAVGAKSGGGIVSGIRSAFSIGGLGSLIGTAVGPGIGTAIGSVIGNAVEAAVSKVAGPVVELIKQGLDLNEVLERAGVHFTAKLGDAKAAADHLDRLNSLEAKSGIDMRELISASQRLEEFNDDLSLTETELKAAAYQSVVFGSGVAGFHAIADALGIIAERGELSSKSLLKLNKQGIPALKYLQEATGLSEKKLKDLMAAGRLNGDVSARIIAEGISIHKRANAEAIITSTTYGQRALYENNLEELAAQSTKSLNRGQGDYYRAANSVLGSGGAQQVVGFIDQTIGTLITKIEQGISGALKAAPGVYQQGQDYINARKEIFKTQGAGVGTAQLANDYLESQRSFYVSGLQSIGLDGAAGLADGFYKGTEKVVASIGLMAQRAIEAAKSPLGFDINSPSKKFIPIGESAAEGVAVGFEDYMNTRGAQRVSAALSTVTERARAEALAQDPRVRAMLDSIGYSEGTDRKHGYQTHVGGGVVSDPTLQAKDRRIIYLGHDRAGRPLSSSASGRYQFINKTWDSTSAALGLTDFSAHSQDLAAIYQLMHARGKNGRGATAISELLGNNFAGAVQQARGVWASFPGAGYNQGERSLASLSSVYNRSLAAGGLPVTHASPLPVMLIGGFGASASVSAGGSFNPATAPAVIAQAQQKLTQTYKDTVPVVVEVRAQQDAMLTTTNDALASMSLYLRQQQIVPRVLGDSTQATQTFSKSQAEFRAALITSASKMQQAIGMLAGGQLNGLLPGGQSTGKRGFFSKLLGAAAPFLSFVPGVGGLLSTVAGIGSNALAGNWAGVVSGVATGLQAGGAFRSSSSNGATTTTSNGDSDLHEARATGGPIRRGRAYHVAEHRAEVVEYSSDGYVHSSVDAYLQKRGGGGGGGGAQHVFARLAAALESFESIPYQEAVQRTLKQRPDLATNAFIEHGSRDPRVVEWMNRRTRT